MQEFKHAMEMAKTLPNFNAIYPHIIDLLNSHFNAFEMAHKDKYDDIMEDLYVIINGPHFNKEYALNAVQGMKNVDGTVGQHWDLDQTTAAAKQAGIIFNTYNEYDFYYVLNMLYSDYFNIFGNDSNTYIQLALAWLNDPDVPEGKAWRYYKKVVKM